MTRILEQTLAANGNSEEKTWSPMRKGAPTRGTVWATGTFGGGSLALEGSPDSGTTWVAIPDQAGSPVAFTENGLINIELYANSADTKVRLVLTGATAPSINIVIDDVN